MPENKFSKWVNTVELMFRINEIQASLLRIGYAIPLYANQIAYSSVLNWVDNSLDWISGCSRAAVGQPMSFKLQIDTGTGSSQAA